MPGNNRDDFRARICHVVFSGLAFSGSGVDRFIRDVITGVKIAAASKAAAFINPMAICTQWSLVN